jgi:TP901 family phage tail tape measure protein
MSDLGSVDLGSAYSRIVIDGSGVAASVAQAERAFQNGLQSIGGMIDNLGEQMTKVGKSLTVLTSPLAVFGATGVKVAASFEDVMVQIKTFGGVAGAELKKVEDFVLKMGADTVFSAQDAGNAMLDLLKSGMQLNDAMKVLPTTLQLATIGNLGLAEATGITTSAMAQFNLKSKDAGKITESLARGANASRADVRDLGQALANVGPVARNFGLSLDQTVAALAVLSNNGIQGAEAGTALKSMLLNLTRPTDEAKGALKALNVSLYDAQGNAKDFGKFLSELDAALDKLPIEQQNELMHTLAGSYGITGLSALRASGGIDKMLKTMKGAPAASKLAAEQSNTFNRALESLKGSIETLQTVALTPFIENVLKPMVKQLIEVVNQVTEWAKANPELTAGIVAFLTGLVAAGPALFILGTVLSQVGTILGVIGGAIAALTSGPILALIAVVGALGAAFATNFLGIRDAVMPIVTTIIDTMGKIVGAIRTAIQQIIGLFTGDDGTPEGGIANGITGAFEALGGTVPGIDIGAKLAEIIRGAAEKIRDAVGEFIGKFGQFILDNLPKVLKSFGDLLGKVGDWLGSDAPVKLFQGLVSLFRGVADWIRDTGWPMFKSGMNALWNMLVDFVKGDGFQRFLGGIRDLITRVQAWLADPGEGGAKHLADGIGAAIDHAARWIVEHGIPEFNAAFGRVVAAIGKYLEDSLPGVIQASVQNGLFKAFTVGGVGTMLDQFMQGKPPSAPAPQTNFTGASGALGIGATGSIGNIINAAIERNERTNRNTTLPRGTAVSGFRHFGGEVLANTTWGVNADEWFKPYNSGQIYPLGGLPEGAMGGNVDQSVKVGDIHIEGLGGVSRAELEMVRDEIFKTVVSAVRKAREQQGGGD